MDALGVGDRVEAQYRGRPQWFAGVVKRMRGSGGGLTLTVVYDDGVVEKGVPRALVRAEAVPAEDVFQVEALNGLMGATGGGEARPTETLTAASLLRAMDSLRTSGYARASDWTPMGLPQHFRYGGVWSPPPL